MELNIGVIGIGAIGRTHIERISTLLKGGRIVAVSDINEEGARKVAAQYDAQVFKTGEELIASDNVDAVIVTSWDQTHAQYVLECLKKQKFVFCEKPLAPNKQDCKRVVEAEVAGGKHLIQVGFMRRYDTGYLQLKKLIQERTYGEPLLLHCAHRNLSVDTNYTTPMAVTNTMIHEIDTLRWLLDENYETVQVIFGKDTKYTHKALHDPQIMMLTTASGVRIDVEAFVNSHYGYDIVCEIVCEEGVLDLPEPASTHIRAHASSSVPIYEDWSERFVQAYNDEFQQWINSTLAGKVEGPSAWDGYLASITATAACASQEMQSVVKIDIPSQPDFYAK